MHGLGNDFMVVDATKQPFNLTADEIGRLGNRKTGVGFDQLLVVEPARRDDVDFNYRIFNTDGSEVQHCGNGARCFAKFVRDKQLSDKRELLVQVKKGLITITYCDDDHIEVAMGQPILIPADVPFDYPSPHYQRRYQLVINDQMYRVSVISMGNPHVVLFVENLWSLDIEPLGKAIQQSHYFPESVNVNFVEPISEKQIELRTYERGVGETDACGTGACASAFVHYRNAHLSEGGEVRTAMAMEGANIAVKVRGGQLLIRIDDRDNIFMSGSARWVFDGQLTI